MGYFFNHFFVPGKGSEFLQSVCLCVCLSVFVCLSIRNLKIPIIKLQEIVVCTSYVWPWLSQMSDNTSGLVDKAHP